MIKSLQIQNFQSHADTLLEFSEGVNVIVGSSDSGKTAIIRALRWLVWNKPGGDSFRSFWGGDTEITLETEKASITRSKGKANRYELNDQSFEAFGTEVPKEIQQELNLSEINLQSQLDSPFLLSNSAGEVAQHFNKVANLDRIDSAQQLVQKWIRELTSDIKYAEGQETKLQESLIQFDHLPKFEIEVEVLEGLESQKKVKQSQFDKLDKLNWDIIENRAYIEQESDKLKIEPQLNQVLEQIEAQKALKVKSNMMQLLCGEIESDSSRITRFTKLLSLETPISEVLSLINNRNTLVIEQKRLKNQLSSLSNIIYQLDRDNANLTRLHKEFETEMGTTCVLCGANEKYWTIK